MSSASSTDALSPDPAAPPDASPGSEDADDADPEDAGLESANPENASLENASLENAEAEDARSESKNAKDVDSEDEAADVTGTPPSGGERHEEGVVVRSTGSWYEVRVNGERIPSRVRGKFRLERDESDYTNPVAVGDRVTIRIIDNEDETTGLITEIHERKNKLSRRSAGRRAGQEHIIISNIDRAWAVQSIRLPRLNPGFLDRFIVSAELFDIPAGIVFNKVDLMEDDLREEVMDLHGMYRDLGYPVLVTSATEGVGVDAFADALTDRVSVVAGPSGAGKSSLLNAVEPGLDVATGEVSLKTNKGKHTTTFYELHPLSAGGYVADTPGIREFGIPAMHPADLAHFFVEFIPYLDDCRFPDCTHDHEPKCAVKDAVDRDEIHERRYESYLSILYSLQDGAEGTGR